jgi:hypothetical protein
MNPQDRKPIPLTEEEKKSPIAKYYTETLAQPTNPAALQALLAGPMDPNLSIKPEQAKTLMQSGYVEGENGYCIMDNGAGYLAVNNKFPGVSLDMMKWWFAWHPLETLRYKIWNPYCHPYAAIADVDRAKITDPNLPIEEKIVDVVHFVVEDIGGGMQDVVIHFRPVEELGFTKEELAANKCYAIGGYGLVENREGQKGKTPAIMLHFYRETEDGIESRTRFWMGYRIVKGHPVCVLPEGIRVPEVVPMGLALHNVEEFSHLASILPKVYEEFGNQPL